MKNIKNGVLPNCTKRFTCEICGCVFEADKGEYYGISQMESLDNLPRYKCKCPTCGSMVYTN